MGALIFVKGFGLDIINKEAWPLGVNGVIDFEYPVTIRSDVGARLEREGDFGRGNRGDGYRGFGIPSFTGIRVGEGILAELHYFHVINWDFIALYSAKADSALAATFSTATLPVVLANHNSGRNATLSEFESLIASQ